MEVNTKRPLVSICIPAFNSGRYIKKTLETILSQDYENLEVIVSDNNSSDNTEDIIGSFNDDRLSFRKNPENIGCYNNYNECLKIASGEFIAFYHSSDVYFPYIVSREVSFLSDNPQVGAVFALDYYMNDNGKIFGKSELPKELKKRDIFDFVEIYRNLLFYGNTFLRTPTFMARRKNFDEIGIFNEDEFVTSSDLEMWLRILTKYPIGILNEKLMKYRVNSSSGTITLLGGCTERADFFRVMDHYSKIDLIRDKIENKIWKKYEYLGKLDDIFRSKNLLKNNDIKRANELLNKTITVNFIVNSLKSVSSLKKLVVAVLLKIYIAMGLNKYIIN